MFFLLLITIFFSEVSDFQEKPPFELDNPTLKIELSGELKEISGLTWYKNQLAAIQDELGIVYRINPATGESIEKIKFGYPGDYEAIINIDKTFYTLTSSGTIYTFNIDNPDDVNRINTPLTQINDTEGIGYNSITNELLIACKESGSLGKFKTEKKAIYAFELSSKTFCPYPVITISTKDLTDHGKETYKRFKPSGISVDPLTCDIFVLASVGNALVVLSSAYQIKAVHKLPGKQYAQPEGICFSPEGNLFISNEATKTQRANIFMFKRND